MSEFDIITINPLRFCTTLCRLSRISIIKMFLEEVFSVINLRHEGNWEPGIEELSSFHGFTTDNCSEISFIFMLELVR